MKRLLKMSLVVLMMSMAGCIFLPVAVDDPGFDFNGIWSLALTGCQRQVKNAEIIQDGTNFTLISGYRFEGHCDPYAETFSARTDGSWGHWTFSGGADGPDTMSGTYLYFENRAGECTGTFTANRISYGAAVQAAGAGLTREP